MTAMEIKEVLRDMIIEERQRTDDFYHDMLYDSMVEHGTRLSALLDFANAIDIGISNNGEILDFDW